MTDCKAHKCWCKDLAQSEKDQVRESLRIMDDRLKRVERVSGKEVLLALTGFERRLNMLDNAFKELLHSCSLKGPYRCPLCEGHGSAMINDHTAEGPRQYHIENHPCSSCKGKGIVWKP